VKLDPMQVFLAILRYVPAIMAVVVAVIFIFSFKVVVQTGELDRTNVEIAENMMASPITDDRAVFDPDKLNAMIVDANKLFYGSSYTNPDGTLKEPQPNIENESIARHCDIGYQAQITDLIDSTKTWTFGYAPYSGKNVQEPLQSTMSYDVALEVKSSQGGGYETVHPARLTLTVQRTWLTQITCAVEDAYEFKQNVTVNVPCLFQSTGINFAGPSTTSCLLDVEKPSAGAKHICLYMPTTQLQGTGKSIAECRYFPKDIELVPISKVTPAYSETKKLVAYPLKTVPDAAQAQAECDSLPGPDQASSNDDVKSVILCLK